MQPKCFCKASHWSVKVQSAVFARSIISRGLGHKEHDYGEDADYCHFVLLVYILLKTMQ